MHISNHYITTLPTKRMVSLFEMADRIEGSGDYWVVSTCRGLAIERRERDANALSVLASWRQDGCGMHGCRGHHAAFACEQPIEEYQERMANNAGRRKRGRPARVASVTQAKAAANAEPTIRIDSIMFATTSSLTQFMTMLDTAGVFERERELNPHPAAATDRRPVFEMH